jgi:hypothetical protein
MKSAKFGVKDSVEAAVVNIYLDQEDMDMDRDDDDIDERDDDGMEDRDLDFASSSEDISRGSNFILEDSFY